MQATSKSDGKRVLRNIVKGMAAAIADIITERKTGRYQFTGLGALMGATGQYAVTEIGGKTNRVKIGRTPDLDTCTCEAATFGRRCKHVDATRKLIALGVL